MPTCCVWGCQNSDRKGFSMRRFPKDPERSAIWISMVNDKNWKPSNSSTLCEVHFDSSSWEKSRCDGKKALKFNAVPSLFLNICDPESSLTSDPLNSSSYTPVEVYAAENPIIDSVEKDPLAESNPIQSQPQITPLLGKISTNSRSVETMKVKIPKYSTQIKTPVEVYAVENTIIDSVEKDPLAESSPIQSQPKTIPLLRKISTSSRSFEAMKVKMPIVTLLQRKLNRSRLLNNNLSYQLKLLRKENTSLWKRSTALQMIFNEDQMKALGRNNTNSFKWSNETIQQALELKFCCGTLGYEKLLQLHYPLPSLRTLRRRLEGEMKDHEGAIQSAD